MGRVIHGEGVAAVDARIVPVYFVYSRLLTFRHSFSIVGQQLEQALLDGGVAMLPDLSFVQPRVCIKQPYFGMQQLHNRQAWDRAPLRVAMDVADSTKLSQSWVDALSSVECHQVWYPSAFSVNTAITCGIPAAKVFRVPHGVHPVLGRDYPTSSPVLAALKADPRRKLGFTWTHSWRRKGADVCARAFGRLARKRRDVVLVVRESLHEGDREVFASALRDARVPSEAVIRFDTSFNFYDWSNFYRALDGFVSPTRGGAFEMQPLEAIACGTPTIVTGGGAPLDYANERNALLIRVVGHPPVYPGIGIEHGHIGTGFEPSEEHLAELMERVVDDPVGVRAALPDLGEPTAARWTWGAAAQDAIAALRRICPGVVLPDRDDFSSSINAISVELPK